MYMMHFFNNPLSWLCFDQPTCTLQRDQAGLLRSLPSFSKYAELMINSGSKLEAQNLARDPDYLIQSVPRLVSQTQASLLDIQHALEILSVINDLALKRISLTYSTMYIKAIAGELSESAIIKALLMAVRKLPSDGMLALLTRLKDIPILPSSILKSHVAALRAIIKRSSVPLRSSHDERNDLVRTSVVAHKVVLNKSKAKLSDADAAYSELAERIEHTLSTTLVAKLVSPRALPFSEAFIYDNKSAVREAFGGAPRAAIERALSRPHDYLACTCCDVHDGALAPSQPATALVYQMYCESGAIINIQDLWMAFRHLVSQEEEESAEKEEEIL